MCQIKSWRTVFSEPVHLVISPLTPKTIVCPGFQTEVPFSCGAEDCFACDNLYETAMTRWTFLDDFWESVFPPVEGLH